MSIRQIKLTQNKFTIIDEEDFERVNQFKWHVNVKRRGNFYAQRGQHIKIGYKQYATKTIYLHRFILNCEIGEIDHINNNTLDNRKENLRIVSHNVNLRNLNSRKNSTSKYVGVHKHKLTGKWRAQIRFDGKTKSLGLFATEEDAFNKRQEFIKLNNLEGFKIF